MYNKRKIHLLHQQRLWGLLCDGNSVWGCQHIFNTHCILANLTFYITTSVVLSGTHTRPTKICILLRLEFDVSFQWTLQFIHVYLLILDWLHAHIRAGSPLLTLLEKQTCCVLLMITSTGHGHYRTDLDMLLLGCGFWENWVGLWNVCHCVIMENVKCLLYLVVIQIQNGLHTISVYLYAHVVQGFIEAWELTSQKLNTWSLTDGKIVSWNAWKRLEIMQPDSDMKRECRHVIEGLSRTIHSKWNHDSNDWLPCCLFILHF
jgi:hypothetical protein